MPGINQILLGLLPLFALVALALTVLPLRYVLNATTGNQFTQGTPVVRLGKVNSQSDELRLTADGDSNWYETTANPRSRLDS